LPHISVCTQQIGASVRALFLFSVGILACQMFLLSPLLSFFLSFLSCTHTCSEQLEKEVRPFSQETSFLLISLACDSRRFSEGPTPFSCSPWHKLPSAFITCLLLLACLPACQPVSTETPLLPREGGSVHQDDQKWTGPPGFLLLSLSFFFLPSFLVTFSEGREGIGNSRSEQRESERTWGLQRLQVEGTATETA